MKIKLIMMMTAVALLGCMGSCNSKSHQAKESAETAELVDKAEGAPIELGDGDILLFEGPIPMPVVVDFTASWCRPCQEFKPIFHKLAKKYKGQVKFITVDVDKCPSIAEEYGVSSVPTLLFVNKQGVINRQIGFMSEMEAESAIQAIMPDPNAAPKNEPR